MRESGDEANICHIAMMLDPMWMMTSMYPGGQTNGRFYIGGR